MPRRFAEIDVNPSKLPSIRAEHFPYSGPYPWLDRDDACDRIQFRLASGEMNAEQAIQCQHWAERGYIILESLIDYSALDDVWTRYEEAIRSGKIKLAPEAAAEGDPHPGRYLNPHKKVGAFCRLLKHPELLGWLKLLTGHQPKPLQTITSHKGTQQAVHSDSIHMTTYPLGYLTAAWVAFEDIHPDSGPLVYYPGSHRLPYVFSKDVDISEADFKRDGYKAYQAKYEPFIRSLVQENRIEPHYFHARKGDVLIWHANLI